jgi:methylenetetrahydrofolate dehydrogenase (NADP+)/methenyltetrahydrofolate cyclohydrolase
VTANLMPGAPVAEAVLAEVGERTAKFTATHGRPPGLGTVLVGDDAPSAHYVARKHETCEALGLHSVDIRIPASGAQGDLLAAIDQLNADPAIDAFIVQNPVPDGFDFNAAMLRIDPAKDADGLHPTNLGLMALGVRDAPRPCTPIGIQAMLGHYGVPVAGRRVVIVGRGPTIGRPLSILLGRKEPVANAAVTLVHTGVPDWADHTRAADIVVGAAGVGNMITPDVIRPGACVIGGGMTWEGRRVISDVDEACNEVAGWITPRLGGVGVTTVAMLLRNTVAAAEQRAG